jgi:hypothetical protein
MERMQEKAAVASFNAIPKHISAKTQERHKYVGQARCSPSQE